MVFHSSHKYQTLGRGIIDDNGSDDGVSGQDWLYGWERRGLGVGMGCYRRILLTAC